MIFPYTIIVEFPQSNSASFPIILFSLILPIKKGAPQCPFKGELKNYIYDVAGQDPASTLQVERGECLPGAERTIEIPNANVIEMCAFTTVAGQSYHIAYDTLHRVECMTPKVITLLDKELPFQQENPRFITDAANPSPCAFSQPKSEKECWEIIEYTLNDDK